jgi:hypothetical protein
MSKTYLNWQEAGPDTYVINNDHFSFVIIPSEKVGCWDLLIDDKVHNNQDRATIQSLDAAKAWADGYYVTWLSDTRSERLSDGRTPTAHAASHNTEGVNPAREAHYGSDTRLRDPATPTEHHGSGTRIMEGKDVDPTREARQ